MEKYWEILKEKIKNGDEDSFTTTWATSISNIEPTEGIADRVVTAIEKDINGEKRDPRVKVAPGYQVVSHIEPDYFIYSDNLDFFTERLIDVGATLDTYGIRIEPRIFLGELIGMESFLKGFFQNYEEFKSYLADHIGLSDSELDQIEKDKKEKLAVREEDGLYFVSFSYNPTTIRNLKHHGITGYNGETKEFYTEYKSFITNLLEDSYFTKRYNLEDVEDLYYGGIR